MAADLPPTAITPPDLTEVHRLLRPRVSELPQVLAQWAEGEGPLGRVPLLDPGMVAPRRFEELAGTVRVVSTTSAAVTMGGLLEIPAGGLLVTAMVVGPHDLSMPPEESRSRAALAALGAASEGVVVEVAALLSPLEGGVGPVAGVGIVRPLVLADPTAFPHADDRTAYGPHVVAAVEQAVAEDREVVADLAGDPLTPLPADLARIWSPMFSVARAATVGLAARGAGSG